MNGQENITKLLRLRLADMKSKNPSYSIRAYAKKLGMGGSTLTMVLNGQRQVSRKVAQQICDRLMLDPMERAALLEKMEKKESKKPSPASVIHYLKISADQYTAMSEWQSMALLNLVRLKEFKNDPHWIAKRLNITKLKSQTTVDRLKRLEMLKESPDGKLVRTQPAFRTSDDVMNASVRKGHFETLDLVRKSLEEDPIDIRDFSALTLTLKQSRLPEAKEMIRRFQSDFVEVFGKDEEADEVYRVSVQAIPLSKKTKESKKEKLK